MTTTTTSHQTTVLKVTRVRCPKTYTTSSQQSIQYNSKISSLPSTRTSTGTPHCHLQLNCRLNRIERGKIGKKERPKHLRTWLKEFKYRMATCSCGMYHSIRMTLMKKHSTSTRSLLFKIHLLFHQTSKISNRSFQSFSRLKSSLTCCRWSRCPWRASIVLTGCR